MLPAGCAHLFEQSEQLFRRNLVGRGAAELVPCRQNLADDFSLPRQQSAAFLARVSPRFLEQPLQNPSVNANHVPHACESIPSIRTAASVCWNVAPPRPSALDRLSLLVLQQRIEETGELRFFPDGLLFVACGACGLC